MGWINDTGKVTKFLNTITSFTRDEYTKQATITYNAKVDELNRKAILDVTLGDKSNFQATNDTLTTQDTFQAVVDSLAAMVSEGPDTAQSRVTKINNNRCVNVLPNINMSFAAAGSASVSAVIPTGCLEVAATNPGSVVPTPASDANQNTPAYAAAGSPSPSPAAAQSASTDAGAADTLPTTTISASRSARASRTKASTAKAQATTSKKGVFN